MFIVMISHLHFVEFLFTTSMLFGNKWKDAVMMENDTGLRWLEHQVERGGEREGEMG